jgi:hypothetical protein
MAKSLVSPSGVTGVALGDVSTLVDDAFFDSESRSAPGLSSSAQERHPRLNSPPTIHENLCSNYVPPTTTTTCSGRISRPAACLDPPFCPIFALFLFHKAFSS